jgi:RNA polymerase sigma-70 factor (ECF subfamily)
MDLNDDQLIQRAVAGDGAALATLLSGTELLLMRFVEKRLAPRFRPTATPDEVVQGVFLDATRLIRGLEPRGRRAFNGWLLRIAHRRTKDVIKSHLARVARGMPEATANEASVIAAIEELAVYRRTPSKSAANRELMELIDRYLGQLPDHYREVVTCRFLLGLGVDETARRMGREPSTIPALTMRAIGSLRDELRTASRLV